MSELYYLRIEPAQRRDIGDDVLVAAVEVREGSKRFLLKAASEDDPVRTPEHVELVEVAAAFRDWLVDAVWRAEALDQVASGISSFVDQMEVLGRAAAGSPRESENTRKDA